MLEKLYKFLDQKVVAIENELGAIKSFTPFAFSSIVQALKLFFVEILKSIVGILILLFSTAEKSFEILRVPAPAYSFETHAVYHKKVRAFSFYGLGTIVAAVVIISLVLQLVIPSRLPSTYAATFTKTWTTQGDFDNNDVTAQGATTKTNVDTAASAGDVKLATVGSDQNFTETFTANTNIDTAASVAEISGGSLALGTGTSTDLSGKLIATWGTYSAWEYRKKITIDKTKVPNTNQTNFPVLINRTDIEWKDTANGGKVGQADGGDIFFTSSDGVTKLNHEIEKYVNTSGELVAWVNVPTVSTSTDTVLYVYYGNASVADQWDIAGTWNSNFKGVWHLKEDPSGTAPQMKDSTANLNSGTSGGSMTSTDQATGQIGGSLDFDALNDLIDLASPATLDDINTFTYTAWISPNTAGEGNVGRIFDKATKFFSTYTTATLRADVNRATTNATTIAVNNSITFGAWQFVAASFIDGDGGPRLYVGPIGGSVAETTYLSRGNGSGTINSDNTFSKILGNVSGGTNTFDGKIDEVRISNVVRSLDWLTTEFNNQSSPSTFYSVAGEETKSTYTGGSWGTYTGAQNALVRASNGDIYVGAASGKFGKYVPGTDTFTDLTSKISSFWSTNAVNSLTYDSTNNVVYLGGGNGVGTGKFAKYTISTDIATDLSGKLPLLSGYSYNVVALTFDSINNVVYGTGDTNSAPTRFFKCQVISPCDGANGIATDLAGKLGSDGFDSLTLDSTNQALYLDGWGPKFYKCQISNPCDGANGNATNLTGKISGFWGANIAKSLTFDSTNGVVYLGGAAGKFAKCITASSCDGANGNATDLTAKISSFWNANTVGNLTFDSTNSVVYLGGGEGKFAKFTPSTDTATDLTAKISGFWSTNAVNAVAYDSTNSLIYLAGAGGKFAKFTSVGATQSAQSIAVDTLSTNIAYATLTKNDTPGTGSVTYQLSNDNGSTWNTVTPGTKYNFTTNGSALKWKISITGNATVQDITIVYNGYTTSVGTITNLKVDATGDAQFTQIAWIATVPTNTILKFRTRGATNAEGSYSTDSARWSPYYTSSGSTITDQNSNPNPTYRYVEIEMYLDSSTTSGSQAPTVNDFTVTYAQNAAPDFASITGVSESSTDGKVTVNFSVRDTDTNTGTTTPGKVNLSLEYCTNAPTCSTWAAATTVTGDVGLKQVCDGSGGGGGLNCALTQYTAYSIIWTPATDYSAQYSNSYKVRIKANDAEAVNATGTAESNTFEFDTKVPTLGSPVMIINGGTNVLTLSATDDNAQTPQIQMDLATSCAALAENWITYASSYDATSILGTNDPKTMCVRFRDYYKNVSSNTYVTTSSAPTNLLLQDTTNKNIGQYQMFLSWGVVSAATKYHIYRSADGFTTRTEVGTINSPSAPNINYYSDTSFSTSTSASNYYNKLYYYRVTAEDSSGNESGYSETKSGTPDGITQAEEGGGTGVTGGGRLQLDTTAPNISSVNVKDVGFDSAKITWATDEVSDSTVYYGFDRAMPYRQSTPSLVISHEVELTGLTPETVYFFKAGSVDTSGNVGTDDNKSKGYTFTTLKKIVDTTAPRVFNVNVSSGSTSATVTWETDEPASSYVDFGKAGEKYSRTQGKEDSVTRHSIAIDKLTASTNYHLTSSSFDKAKNRGASEDFPFRTLAEGEEENVFSSLAGLLAQGDAKTFQNLRETLERASANLPSPKIVGGAPSVEATSTAATIRWNTDLPSSSVVALAPAALYPVSETDPYITTTGNFNESVISHEVSIINLAPSTLYHYQLRSKPIFGPEGRSGDFTFSTRSLTPEIFGETIKKVSQNQATLIWSTNVQADSVAKYTPYRDNKPNLAETKIQGKPDLVFDHEITLVGLEYGTLYAIELASTDKLNNVIRKELRPFSTSVDLVPPSISQIRTESAVVSGTREQVQTIIFWKTDEPSTSQVIYQEGLVEDTSSEKTTLEDTNLTENHVVVITSFKPGVVYRFKVKSKDSFGNAVESSNFTLLAPRQRETIVQIILKNFEDTFGWLKLIQL